MSGYHSAHDAEREGVQPTEWPLIVATIALIKLRCREEGWQSRNLQQEWKSVSAESVRGVEQQMSGIIPRRPSSDHRGKRQDNMSLPSSHHLFGLASTDSYNHETRITSTNQSI